MIDKIEKTLKKASRIKDIETRHYIIKALAGLKVLYGRNYTAPITIKIINDRIKNDIKRIIREEKSELGNIYKYKEDNINAPEKIIYCTGK